MGMPVVAGATRLVGVDLARAIALAGMMAAHTALQPSSPAAVVAAVDGPPSTLFAVLGGASLVLASRRRLAEGRVGAAVRAAAARGLAVLLLGLLLVPVAPAVVVVLPPFGLAIAVCATLLAAPSAVLWALLVPIAALGGWAAALADDRLPALQEPLSIATVVAEPVASLAALVLTGVYPALTWTGYLLVGMLLARWLLARRAAGEERAGLVRLAGLGALLVGLGVASTELALHLLAPASGGLEAARDALVVNGYGAASSGEPLLQLVAAPHTGTPADVARTVGIALLVVAATGLAAARLPAGALRALAPVRAMGAAPLTVYALHAMLVSVLLVLGPEAVAAGWGGWALQLAVGLAIGAGLAATGARGPLEAAVGALADRAARDEPGKPGG